MSRRALLVLIAALVLVPNAAAGFGMNGEGASRHWTWVHAAQANVPLPNAHVRIFEDWNLLPEFFQAKPGWLGQEQNVIDLPRPGRGGWDYHAEHGLLLHELGHLYDFANMTPALRRRFDAIVGTRCRWWAKRCVSSSWILGPGVSVDLPPGEMFGETYAACALGLSVADYIYALYNSYGWVPPQGTDAALCDVIRAARIRDAVAALGAH
jgi:hypothetical protein